MTGAKRGTGASRSSDIAPEFLEQLNHGTVEARTLTEALAIDHARLLLSAIPDAPPALRAATANAQQHGILRRMREIGSALHTHLGCEELAVLSAHPSDTVRGWVCFAHGAAARQRDTQPGALITQMLPFSDDAAFTVREWVWMAVRPQLVMHLDEALAALSKLTVSPSDRIRRFASETLRPRGVWAAHITELLQHPERGETLLTPLRNDPSRYVQDSVANWINDAAKLRPDWAHALCAGWRADSPTPETLRITTRGLRSVRTG